MFIYEKEKQGEVAKITFNKPEKLNCMTFSEEVDLAKLIRRADEDDEVKVILLQGAGKAFCSGHDLSEVGFVYGFGTGKPGERRPSQRIRLWKDRNSYRDGAYAAILASLKPVIAKVHGYCLEQGVFIQACADITIAAEDAKFGMPMGRMAFGGGCLPLQLLVYLIGPKKMRELVLTGKQIDGTEAERIGLINKAVVAGELDEEVEKMVESVLTVPADSIVIGKAITDLAFDSMGMGAMWKQMWIGHVLGTNLRLEPDEFNFFKTRREKGAHAAFHERDKNWRPET